MALAKPRRTLLLACALLGAPSGAARAQGDAAVFARIEALRPVAAAIAIDGSCADWAAIPELPDPSGDAGGDASRDITGVALAPQADALAVKLETAGPPSGADLAFWLDLDFRAHEPLDLQLGLYPGFPDILWIYEEGAPATFHNWDFAVSAVGSCVELRIPYAELDAVLPASMQGQLSGSAARSWLRVRPFTVDIASGETVDRGAAAASFRLVATPYPLDPPLAPGGGATVEIPLPLAGAWYVGQGAFGLFSHASSFAYDLHRVNGELHPDDPFESPDNADYFSFGEPVTAPVAGSVFSVDGSQPDLPPRSASPPAAPPNFVFLDIGGDIGLLFSHLRSGSVSLAQGAPVAAGQALGEVGHSGSASWPHLHLDAQDIAAGFATRPIALRQVRVGLNPIPHDPWARRLASWGVREGFFAEALPPSLPALGAPARGALAIALVCAGALLRARRSRREAARRNRLSAA